jgi:hypothetical protein
MPSMPKVTPQGDIDFEAYGTAVGGLVAAGLYSLTAPVTLIDGPLPFVDAAWLLGLGAATYRGAALGRRVGSYLDSAESLVRS